MVKSKNVSQMCHFTYANYFLYLLIISQLFCDTFVTHFWKKRDLKKTPVPIS